MHDGSVVRTDYKLVQLLFNSSIYNGEIVKLMFNSLWTMSTTIFHEKSNTYHISKPIIGHFRIVLCLFFKAGLRAKPFIWKWVLSACEWKLIFIWKPMHQASLWKRGRRQFRNGLLEDFFPNLVPLRSLQSSFIDSFSFAKKRCNASQGFAPFSFSHVIDACSLLSLFSLSVCSFLIL